MSYKLTSGQINFENQDQPGAYACVVIKDGKFFNMKDDHKQMIKDALDDETPVCEEPTLEDMF